MFYYLSDNTALSEKLSLLNYYFIHVEQPPAVHLSGLFTFATWF